MLLYCSERTRTPIKALRASQRAYSTQNDKLYITNKKNRHRALQGPCGGLVL